jgi:hypothetical protein
MSRKSFAWLLAIGTCAAFAVAQDKSEQQQGIVPSPAVPLLSFDDGRDAVANPEDDEASQTPAEADVGSLIPGPASSVPPLAAKLRLLPPQRTPGTPVPALSKNLHVDSAVPNLRVVTKGPDTLIVGKKSTYVIAVQNLGTDESGAVVVRCSLPSWVELNRQKATAGKVEVRKDADSVAWQVASVPANGTQQLRLELTPRAGKPFDLNVELAVQPGRSKTQIAIREPKLNVQMKGPESFVFDEDGRYTVTLSNPGSAPTENVTLSIRSGDLTLAQQKIGTVPANGQQVVELDLKAALVGNFPVEAVAVADPGLTDNAQSVVLVRRASPKVSIQGSAFEFAGTDSLYNVTVSNNGDAPMNYATVRMNLPKNARYISGLDSPSLSATDVSWVIEELPAGAHKVFSVVVRLAEKGSHEFKVTAKTTDDLVAKASTATNADTSADLKLNVTEPRGPQPLGKIVEYEIRVANVGSADAKDISIIAAYPPELEAIDVTGDAAIKSGQIFFRPIKQIDHGREVVHKVKVRATEAGNHNFRVVVRCQDPNLRFAAEDTTRYFNRNARRSRAAEAKKPRAVAVPIQKVTSSLPRIIPN